MFQHNSFLVRHAQMIKESALPPFRDVIGTGAALLGIVSTGLVVAKTLTGIPNAQKTNVSIAQLSNKAFNEFRDTPKKKIQEAVLTVVQAMPNSAGKVAISVMYTYVKSILAYGSPSVDLVKSMADVDSKRQGGW